MAPFPGSQRGLFWMQDEKCQKVLTRPTRGGGRIVILARAASLDWFPAQPKWEMSVNSCLVVATREFRHAASPTHRPAICGALRFPRDVSTTAARDGRWRPGAISVRRLGAAKPGSVERRGASRIRTGQVVHRPVLLGRYEPPGYLGSEAGGARRNARAFSADLDRDAGHSIRRARPGTRQANRAAGNHPIAPSSFGRAWPQHVLELDRARFTAPRICGEPASVSSRLAIADCDGGPLSSGTEGHSTLYPPSLPHVNSHTL